MSLLPHYGSRGKAYLHTVMLRLDSNQWYLQTNTYRTVSACPRPIHDHARPCLWTRTWTWTWMKTRMRTWSRTVHRLKHGNVQLLILDIQFPLHCISTIYLCSMCTSVFLHFVIFGLRLFCLLLFFWPSSFIYSLFYYSFLNIFHHRIIRYSITKSTSYN